MTSKYWGEKCACVSQIQKKSLVVKQSKYSRTTVDNDGNGIWDLHLIAGVLQFLRFSPEEINIKTDKWPTVKPESCRKKNKNPRSQRMMSDHMAEMTREDIIQPQLCGSYVTPRRPTSITT